MLLYLLQLGKICIKSIRHAKQTQIRTLAASLAFTTVLSIVPLLAVGFYIFKVMGGLDNTYTKLLPFLLSSLSEGAGQTVSSYLDQFVQQVHAKAVGWVGLAGLLLTWVATYMTIFRAFNQIWKIEKPPSFFSRIGRAFILLTCGPIFVAGSLAITTTMAAKITNLPFRSTMAAIFLNTVLFAMLYWLVPSIKIPSKAILAGAFLAGLLLESAKFGYAIYVTHTVTYTSFYGSFAAIPLFLLWIYIAWYITLFGAVWVYTIQHSRKELHD